MPRLHDLAVLACGVALASAQPGKVACGPGFDHFPFCNDSMPLDDRVYDLVKRINDADKPNLLTARGHSGRQALPELGVPSYYWGSNCIHSSMFSRCTDAGRCSTSFPSGPSWAATYDRELMRKMAVVIGQETRAGWNLGTWLDNGVNGAGLDCWGPVININRDPRWGRNGEGGAEDPYLMGELGKAWTLGLQRGNASEGAAPPKYVQVVVTLKHFDANAVEGGSSSDQGKDRHTVNANLSNYLLSDYYWPAFRKAIAEADAKGVMCSYNEVNGVPTCLSPLMKAARDQWNFTGYVTSDSDSISDAWVTHRYVQTAGEASCLGVKDGGCDIDSGNTYYSSLLDGVKAGHCSMADVDRAVFNSLRVRFELGLFDAKKTAPYWGYGEQTIGTPASTELNGLAAAKSLVLLSNPGGVLPFKPGCTVAVIGPHGNASANLIQRDTGKICSSGMNESRVFTYDCVTSPYAAIAAANAAAGGTTTYTEGSGLFVGTAVQLAEAVAAAKAADVVVLGIGIAERSPPAGPPAGPDPATGRAPDPAAPYIEHEAHDRDSIDLPEPQKALVAAVLAVGKPTAAFVLNGGAVSVPPTLLSKAAVVEAFYPGMEGAGALAAQIFGKQNRWGKMPYTIYPSSWTATHPMLDMDVTHGRTYRYGADATVAFGAGLSLTTFKLGFAAPPPSGGVVIPTDGSASPVRLAVQVTNAGGLAGDEVVQMYLHPLSVPTLTLYPVKTLVDFARLDNIPPGGSATASFNVVTKTLLLASEVGDLVSAPGKYKLTFENGAGQVLSVPLVLTGAEVVVEPFPKPSQK